MMGLRKDFVLQIDRVNDDEIEVPLLKESMIECE